MTKLKFPIAIAVLLTAVFFTACGKNADNADKPTGILSTPGPTFTYINEAIIQPKCVQCHSPGKQGAANGDIFTTYAGVLETVIPNDPENSELYDDLINGYMPKGGPQISPTDLKFVYDWIKAGALQN